MPPIVPIFPLAEALLLPRGELPLTIFEPRYLAMIDMALASDRLIGMIQPLDSPDDESQLAGIGTVGKITTFIETDDGRYYIVLTGVSRFRFLEEVDLDTPFRNAQIQTAEFIDDFRVGAGEQGVDRRLVLSTLHDYVTANELEIDWPSVYEASNEALVNGLSMICPYNSRAKQALLEASDLAERAELLIALTQRELSAGQDYGSNLQ